MAKERLAKEDKTGLGNFTFRTNYQFSILLPALFSSANMQHHCARRLLCPTPVATRGYAISVKPPKKLAGKKSPRVFKDKKAFQYNWYSRILNANATSPLLILHHNEFTASRLRDLRAEILAAFRKASTPSLTSPQPVAPTEPVLTVVRTSIFGAALRDLPSVDLGAVSRMINDQSGSFAVLSFPTLNPPQIAAVLRAMDRNVPHKPPKTEAELKAIAAEKDADPAQPGKRMKRQRQIRIPELKLMGAIIENRVFLAPQVSEVSKLPTLDTLRAQIVGLLSAPSSQLAAVLNEAAGGRLARTLEGLKKGLEEGDDASTSI